MEASDTSNPDEIFAIKQSLIDEIMNESMSPEQQETLLESFLLSQGRFVSWKDGTTGSKNNDLLHDPSTVPITSILPTSVDAPHFACGACGIKSVHGRYGNKCMQVSLEELPVSMQLTAKQNNAYQSLKEEEPLHLPVDEEGHIGVFRIADEPGPERPGDDGYHEHPS